MNNGGNNIRGTLIDATRTVKASATVSGALLWFVACFGSWILLCFFDNLLNLPAGIRLPLALAVACLTAAVLVVKVIRPALRRLPIERTALTLESAYRVRHNAIINACQMEAAPLTSHEQAFARHTVEDGRIAISAVPMQSLWNAPYLYRWGSMAGVIALAWTLYLVISPRYAMTALKRYALPLSDIPPPGQFVIRTWPSSDVAVSEGDDLDVRVALERPRAIATSPVPPLIRWVEGSKPAAPDSTAGRTEEMLAIPGRDAEFAYSFRHVQRTFTFRVTAGDTYSGSIRVKVLPLPTIASSVFRVLPPSYTGLAPKDMPGPPSPVAALPGSRLQVAVEFDRRVSALRWKTEAGLSVFAQKQGGWGVETVVTSAGPYEVEATIPGLKRPVIMARGEINLEADQPPVVDFVTEDRNRFVPPGISLELPVEASDDFGIQSIRVLSRSTDGASATNELKAWAYLGPPGRRGPLSERLQLTLDPRVFAPGSTYILEALCRDFSPDGVPGRSRPVILKVKSLADLSLAREDPLCSAFDFLRKAADEQRRAHGMTANLQLHLDEAVAGKTLPTHRDAMSERQRQAQENGKQALAAFRGQPDGRPYAARLSVLTENEMALALSAIQSLPTQTREQLPQHTDNLARRQHYILMELLTLLGEVASERSHATRATAALTNRTDTLAQTIQDAARDLRKEMEDFKHSQERIIERSRSLQDKKPDDLTAEEQEILGQLAREEAQWSKFFEEKLTDFSKLPLQDFADGSIAKEINEVFQEVQLAAKSLYEKKVELAVPQEQSGLENAEQLVNNLERWMPDTPDHLKWLMEEPPQANDIAIADLPDELEDIVGELLDKEENMTEDVEDVTSSWMDSIDKGAGWDAADGPISSMSAKGITGNQLPNQQEIGGRSGEGRTGRSSGQMVEETAEGKGGRDTPTRLTPSPFEQGSVKDTSKQPAGGATGGGKLSGFGEKGLFGSAPPPRLDGLARLGSQQMRIRQEAEALDHKLRAYNLPSGDMEVSITAMKRLEAAAASGDGVAVRRAYSQAIDNLKDSWTAVRAEAGIHREQSKLTPWQRDQIMTGLREGTPRGYEEMAARYFRAMAEGAEKEGK